MHTVGEKFFGLRRNVLALRKNTSSNISKMTQDGFFVMQHCRIQDTEVTIHEPTNTCKASTTPFEPYFSLHHSELDYVSNPRFDPLPKWLCVNLDCSHHSGLVMVSAKPTQRRSPDKPRIWFSKDKATKSISVLDIPSEPSSIGEGIIGPVGSSVIGIGVDAVTGVAFGVVKKLLNDFILGGTTPSATFYKVEERGTEEYCNGVKLRPSEGETPTQAATGTLGHGNEVAPLTFLDKLRAFLQDNIEGTPTTDADHSEAFCGLLKHVEGLFPPPPDFDLNLYKHGV